MKKLFDFLSDIPRAYFLAGNVFFVLLLGLIDFSTGVEIGFSIFYFLPVSLISWYNGKKAGIIFSFLCAAAWLLADLSAGHLYTSNLIIIWNTLMRLGMFLVIASLMTSIKLNVTRLHEKDLVLKRGETIIQTSQKLTGLIAEYITTQNAEILKWVDSRKKRGQQVSHKVEDASRVIGSCLQILSEISFVYPYTVAHEVELDQYIQQLEAKLAQASEKVVAASVPQQI